jgi:hypothetical protein
MNCLVESNEDEIMALNALWKWLKPKAFNPKNWSQNQNQSGFYTFGLFGVRSFLFYFCVVPLLDIFPLFIYLFKTKGSIENKRMLEPRLKVLFESSIHLTLRLV